MVSNSQHMCRINPGKNIIEQLYGGPVVHVGNFSDEIVTGAEGLRCKKECSKLSTYFQKSKKLYSLRMITALPESSISLVPESLIMQANETLRYLDNLGLCKFHHVEGIREYKDNSLIDNIFLDIEDLAKLLSQKRCRTLFPYIVSENIVHLASHLNLTTCPNNSEPIALANHKGQSFAAMNRYGVCVPYGHWITEPAQLVGPHGLTPVAPTNPEKLRRAPSPLG